jgi:CRISPR/Cas system-associated endoribonuclease Cas2
LWSEGEAFLKSQLYEAIKKQLKRFLVEAASNIISTSFKHLCKHELEEREAKEYAVKNIILNLHSAYQRTACALRQHPQIKRRIKEEEWAIFVSELDSILAHTLNNLADLYPMATPSGGTLRMRNIINEVNRVDDEENDFIFCNGIKISDYLTLGDHIESRT